MPNVKRMVKEYEAKVGGQTGGAPPPTDNLGKDRLKDPLTPAKKESPPPSLESAPKEKTIPAPAPLVAGATPGALETAGKTDVEPVEPKPLEPGAQRFDRDILGPNNKKLEEIRIKMLDPMARPFAKDDILSLGGKLMSEASRLMGSRPSNPMSSPALRDTYHDGTTLQAHAATLLSLLGEFLTLEVDEMLGRDVSLQKAAMAQRIKGTLLATLSIPYDVDPEIWNAITRASTLAGLYQDMHVAKLQVHRQ